MKAADIITPEPLLAPIANQGLRNTLPDNATGTNYASIEEGFPEITMKAPKDGGLPPWGQDFNGMFYLMSSQTCFLQNGGLITFDQAVSDKIDGYPQGAILDYVTPENTYVKVKSLIDDNTYNFVTTPSYIDGEHWEEVTLAATTSWGDITGNIENQTDLQTVLNNQLNKTQLSNCILEIPQNINLVDNGTNIIIKAGTIGIQPNGFEADGSTPKFDYITVTADITLENNQTTTVMLGLNGAQNVYRTPINRCFSGLAAPESPVNLTIWYDTSTNLVKRYVNSAWSVENFTLSLGILNYTASGTPGSIQQVFNGFGYIGSSLWVDKGVRMLIPNYRNDDGTLKNQDFTTEKIYLTYFPSNYTRVNGKLVFLPDVIFDNIDIWADPEYDSAKNIMVSSAEEYSMIILSVGGNTVENGVIKSINIPQTVSLADNQYLEGFWVKRYAILLSSTTVGTYTIDLTSYLPNDNQAYEILLKQSMHNTNSSNAALFVETQYIPKSVVITSNSGSTTNYNTFSVPVGNNHILKYYLEGVSPNSLLVEALAYKRTK